MKVRVTRSEIYAAMGTNLFPGVNISGEVIVEATPIEETEGKCCIKCRHDGFATWRCDSTNCTCHTKKQPTETCVHEFSGERVSDKIWCRKCENWLPFTTEELAEINELKNMSVVGGGEPPRIVPPNLTMVTYKVNELVRSHNTIIRFLRGLK